MPPSASSSSASSKKAVQVVLRIRPLISEEEGDAAIAYKLSKDGKAVQLTPAEGSNNKNGEQQQQQQQQQDSTGKSTVVNVPPPLRRRLQNSTVKTYSGLTHILTPTNDNQHVYETAFQPVVQTILSKTANVKSACIFTYGHTGSGKTHTLLGYGNEFGMYKYAAQDLFEQFNKEKSGNDDKNDNDYCILVTATELYQDKVMDLFTGDEGAVRQNDKGMAVVRGPMVEDDQGRLEQRSLGKVCHTAEELLNCVETAIENRRVGTSTHHGQSSRSHLILELEVVTPALLQQRQTAAHQEAQLTRLKWLQTEKMYGKHTDRPFPEWCHQYNDPKQPSILRNAIKEAEKTVKTAQNALTKIEKSDATPLLQQSLVFCDLAGNEYGQDSASSTSQALGEAAGINRSLLALKNVLNSLRLDQQNAKHYRDSKLTMLLHRHMCHSQTVMMAHMSPSEASWRKTINTLNYTKMSGGSATAVAKASGSARKTAMKKRTAAKTTMEKAREQPTENVENEANNNSPNTTTDAIPVQA
eukprot:CAMPEP_0168779038 /NCGR_PEP_ID=MMETSP0725-20121227/7387_1 /TAXON_ID=265536 /ORGANISM="Amphiprora sp., Strain CCMP467" /LENGTH=526 /DNA_ID=CAMNT_0008828817 /DNA_START=40 /DNA_END=1620 /DNA_ORIENTATION=-